MGLDAPRSVVSPSALDVLLRPLHRWIFRDPARRARKLLRFAETEADGARDLSRAAELTADPLLRRLYLRHAQDELRHAGLFRARGRALAGGAPAPAPGRGFEANFLAPGERGLDDLRVEAAAEAPLLAFLHLSEKAAAGRFAVYRSVLAEDPVTASVFSEVLKDEAFHMSYTHVQLLRVSSRGNLELWKARLSRLWNAYLRAAAALASVLGTVTLLAQYFLRLPVFALLAKPGAGCETQGGVPSHGDPPSGSQYQARHARNPGTVAALPRRGGRPGGGRSAGL